MARLSRSSPFDNRRVQPVAIRGSLRVAAPRGRRAPTLVAAMSPATEAENEGNKKRFEESGKQGSVDQWRWTLNWDDITDKIVVGSCPRSVEDVETLVTEAKVDAIVCLQSDGCFDALKIDYETIRRHGTSLGVIMTRVAIWDFNHNDQALMLPEAVRMLATLLSMGRRVYVHCTAGINRATLTVVGYLTFVKGWEMHEAVEYVKRKRPQAHPYMDCWKTVRRRLTEDRTEEAVNVASRIYEKRHAGENGSGSDSDDFKDWVAAEGILITELFQRQLQADLSLIMSVQDVATVQAKETSQVCMTHDEYSGMQSEVGMLRAKLDDERRACRAALLEVKMKSAEIFRLREAYASGSAEGKLELESREMKDERMRKAETEIFALKQAIRGVAISAFNAVKQGKRKPNGPDATLLPSPTSASQDDVVAKELGGGKNSAA